MTITPFVHTRNTYNWKISSVKPPKNCRKETSPQRNTRRSQLRLPLPYTVLAIVSLWRLSNAVITLEL